jgi:translation elongation factor EF-1alpha
MDEKTVNYSEKRFNEIVANCTEFLGKTGYKVKKKV